METEERIRELELVMRVEIPMLPPKEANPNWRGHWAQKYKAGRVYHDAVFYECVNARNKTLMEGMSFPFIKARLNLTFVFPEQRRRDRDNLLACFKPGLDGIVNAGLVIDDDAEHLLISNLSILVDPERAPLTVIDLGAVEENRNEPNV